MNYTNKQSFAQGDKAIITTTYRTNRTTFRPGKVIKVADVELKQGECEAWLGIKTWVESIRQYVWLPAHVLEKC
ncbi:hypothetical protein BDD43_3419 [Mucilaginibacter gracilis]|uniref:Uncharacterized protein n=1 Tax=Mucilaginibacter gracilis TaxID=423350 RepID=A0A495J2Q4_9SPHI|nr:hypothetical protein [Mucilaginibacter gracilis]RKR83217.1 hypothetical protein BDD43_3419 [Mucilaginibacter gracilis]